MSTAARSNRPAGSGPRSGRPVSLAQPAHRARHCRDQPRRDQVGPAVGVEDVELGPPRRLVHDPVGRAGLLGADHLVDAVVEQRDVGPHPLFQQLLQRDRLLRAVVAELADIGDRGRLAEFAEAARQHRRDGLPVARPHAHHRRAAEAQDAHGVGAGLALARGRPQAALVDRHVLAAVRPLPPADMLLPVDPHRPAELVEIGRRPVRPAIGVGAGRAGRPGDAAAAQPANPPPQPVDAELGEQHEQHEKADDVPQRRDEANRELPHRRLLFARELGVGGDFGDLPLDLPPQRGRIGTGARRSTARSTGSPGR